MAVCHPSRCPSSPLQWCRPWNDCIDQYPTALLACPPSSSLQYCRCRCHCNYCPPRHSRFLASAPIGIPSTLTPLQSPLVCPPTHPRHYSAIKSKTIVIVIGLPGSPVLPSVPLTIPSTLKSLQSPVVHPPTCPSSPL